MKKCTKCNLKKDLKEFYKHKTNIDGLFNTCKKCYSNKSKTFKEKIKQIYRHQKYNSKQREHNPPSYSQKELIKWCKNSIIFVNLFNNWVNSGFENNLSPSIDRLEDDKGYAFENIQAITWEENENKGWEDRKHKKQTKQTESIVKYDLNGNMLKEYFSISRAAREVKGDKSNISKCCKGKRKTAYGYIWKYKNYV